MWVRLLPTCGSTASEEWTWCVNFLGSPVWAPTLTFQRLSPYFLKREFEKKVHKLGTPEEEWLLLCAGDCQLHFVPGCWEVCFVFFLRPEIFVTSPFSKVTLCLTVWLYHRTSSRLLLCGRQVTYNFQYFKKATVNIAESLHTYVNVLKDKFLSMKMLG